MKLQVFSVYDQAVGLFLPPIFLRSKAEAVRALRMSLKGEHQFASSPKDYSLHRLGEFDEASGEFSEGREFVVELAALMED